MSGSVNTESGGATSNATATAWFTSTDAVNRHDLLNDYLKLLDADERRRHLSFRFSADQHLYLVAHALLRTSLSQCAAVSPQDWRFSSRDGERPVIVQNCGTVSQLRFSLSHTPGLAACIIAECVDVGVDVECLSRNIDSQAISSRYFAACEKQQLAGLSGSMRQTRFFEYWTLKEAYLKACGLGLSIPLDSFCFYRDNHAAWRIRFLSKAESPANAWQFLCVRPTRDHVMAIAIHDPNRQIEHVTIRETVPLCGPPTDSSGQSNGI